MPEIRSAVPPEWALAPGPCWAGACLKTAPGAPVACAGLIIVVHTPAVDVKFVVAPDALSCPLAVLGLSPADSNCEVVAA